MAVRIRSFAKRDLSRLVELLNEVSKGSYEFIPANEEKLESQIEEWDIEALLAEEESRIIGSPAYNNGHWVKKLSGLVALKVHS